MIEDETAVREVDDHDFELSVLQLLDLAYDQIREKYAEGPHRAKWQRLHEAMVDLLSEYDPRPKGVAGHAGGSPQHDRGRRRDPMSTEDKTTARQLAQADLARLLGGSRSYFVGYNEEGIVDPAMLPDDDGDHVLMPIMIGERGSLSKAGARTAARTWRELTTRYPKGMFVICLLGYDQDPREIWEIPEACGYVRWWATYAGMDDIETADRLVGTQSAIIAAGVAAPNHGLAFLAGCGVFGEEMRQFSLTGVTPTAKQ